MFGDTVERNFDARLGVLLEGLVAGSELNAEGGLELRLQLGEPRFEQPLSGWYWQIADRGKVLRRSPSLWDAQLPVSLASGTPTAAQDVAGPDGQPLRLLVRAITLPGAEAPLLYAVAADRAYERAIGLEPDAAVRAFLQRQRAEIAAPASQR